MFRDFRNKFNKIKSNAHPIKFLLSRLLWYTHLSSFLVIQKENYRLRFFPTGSSADQWVNPDVLHADEKFISSYARYGDTVVDVGANIGTSTLLSAAIVGDTGAVYSIEAHPKIYSYLRSNVQMNNFNNVYMSNFAVGNSDGFVQFSNVYSDESNHVVNDNGINVGLSTLNNILSEYKINKIDLIKIDVEGYEKFVVEGASTILPKTDCLFFEVIENHFERYGYTSSDLFCTLSKFGFQVYNASDLGGNLLATKDPSKLLERIGSKKLTRIA